MTYDYEKRMKEFKEKLSNLMKEYNVIVGFSVSPDSDTRCLYDEHVYFANEEYEININRWTVSYQDVLDGLIKKN